MSYIAREVGCPCVCPTERFLLLRDQAFLKLLFFTGGRAGDLVSLLSQELRRLPEDQGFVFRLTCGKTFSTDKPHTFTVLPCPDRDLCPVLGLASYMTAAQQYSICLSPGYLFRLVDRSRGVLDTPLTYDAIYVRLRRYLSRLGIYQGETPHSLRGGCAVTMAWSGAARSADDLMSLVGWRSAVMPRRYSRVNRLVDSSSAARLTAVVADSQAMSTMTSKFHGAFFDSLPVAFPP